MGIHRHFIGWDRPFTLEFAKRLQGESGGADMDDWLIWVPSARAGRHILSELFCGEVDGVEAFHPPRFQTPAQFEQSLPAIQNCASEAVRLLAWKTVIFGAREADLAGLFPVVPMRQKHQWAYALAGQLVRLRARLVAEGFDFGRVAGSALENDRERWLALAQLEKSYLAELRRAGYTDGDAIFDERLQAYLPSMPYKRLLVAGILNLSKRQVRCMEALADAGLQVDIYSPLPPAMQDAVDPHGRPKADYWTNEPLPGALVDTVLQRSAEPRELVDKALELAEVYRSEVDALVMGAPDAELGKYLVERSRLTDTPVYMPEGKALANTSWGRLIHLLSQARSGSSMQTLLELLRHAVFRKWATLEGCRVSEVEQALVTLMKERLILHTGQLRDSAFKPIHEIGIVREFLGRLETLLQAESGSGFAEGLWAIVQTMAKGTDLSDETKAVLSEVEELLGDIYSDFAPGALHEEDFWEILRYLLEAGHYYPEREAGERPVSGWLELPWERAPHLVILGLPDSKVPGNDGTDSFLTPALCRQLGLYGPDEAAAFHAFRLRLLLESRRDWGKMDILLPDRGLDDDPERPSRFLFLADEADILARVELLMGERPDVEGSIAANFGRELVLPEPAPLERISVTDFGAYLYSPFHYLLERSFRWSVPQQMPVEMDALRFGSLAHAVLELLNGSEAGAKLSQLPDIATFLDDQLSTRMRQEFGGRLSVPVIIQESGLRERLRAAAGVISDQRLAGWRPVKTEWRFANEIDFQIDGVRVSGVVDLVERNEESGLYRVVDYKTSDSATEAQAAHMKRTNANSPEPLFPECDFVENDKAWRWKDLQLILYYHAVKQAFGEEPTVAYLSLAKAVKEVRLSPWAPSETQADSGLACAAAIIRQIRGGHFPLGPSIRFKEDWLPWFGGDYEAGISADWRVRHMEVGL